MILRVPFRSLRRSAIRFPSLVPALYTAATVLLVGFTVLQVARVFTADSSKVATYQSWLIDSDLCWPAVLYQDVIRDGYSLRTFQFSAVTFWFPDVACFFAIRAVVGSAGEAIVIWAWAVFLLVVLAAAWMTRTFADGPARGYALALVASLGAIYAGYIASFSFQTFAQQQFLLPLYRPGTLACLFAALALTGGVVRRGGLWQHLALAVLCTLAVFSDRLFGVWFTVPVILAVVACRLLIGANGNDSNFPVAWSRVGSLALAVGAGSLLGHFAILTFPTDTVDPLANYFTGVVWKDSFNRLVLFGNVLWAEIIDGNALVIAAAVWYPVCAAVGLRAIILRVANAEWRTRINPAFTFFCLFSLVMAACGVAVFILTKTSYLNVGKTPWPGYSRYFQGQLGMAIFGWAVLASRGIMVARRAWLRGAITAVPLVCLVVLNASLTTDGRGTASDLTDIYPDFVADIDRVCQERNLHHGLAGYWLAKRVSVLSRAGVVLHQTTHCESSEVGFHADFWLNNGAHFWRGPADSPDDFRPTFFVVPTSEWIFPELNEDLLTARLGEPAERIPIRQNLVMLIYNRPQDSLVHNFAEFDEVVLNLKFRMNRPHAVRYPGTALYSHLAGNGMSCFPERSADPRVPAGNLMTYGPYLIPPVGRYQATFHTSSDLEGRPGTMQVMATSLDGEPSIILAEARIPAGAHRDTVLNFHIKKKFLKSGSRVEFYTFYPGGGRTTIHWVDVAERPTKP